MEEVKYTRRVTFDDTTMVNMAVTTNTTPLTHTVRHKKG